MLNKRKLNRLKAISWFEESCRTKYDKANQKKQQLLEMARNGEEKPTALKHYLGSVLGFYTNSKSQTYDPVFDKQIRQLRPDWFMSKSDITNQNKEKLLEMAKGGEPRPNRKFSLGELFKNYTNLKSKSYDPFFVEKIKEIRPDWIIYRSNVVDQKKQKLLEMAKNGEPRPNQKTHSLGTVLGFYTTPKSQTYDPVFDKEIRELRSDWFVSRSETANQKKQELLQMAKNGEPKPSRNDPLGSALNTYTKKSKNNMSYDPEFKKEIRELRPDWFISRSDITDQKKQQLLNMTGELKPSKKHLLGIALRVYTNPKSGSYDPVFDKEIRELRPDWFKNTKQTKTQAA